MNANPDQLYYDPYDAQIKASPWATYRRMRDEAPLFYNEEHDCFALSRHADVEQGLRRLGDVVVESWRRSSSSSSRDSSFPRGS